MSRFNITLAETKVFKGNNDCVVSSHPIYYEFVSRYRRVVVLGDESGFIARTSYKGLPVKKWESRWKEKQDAVAWAKVYTANNEIIIGCLTIKDYGGKQTI